MTLSSTGTGMTWRRMVAGIGALAAVVGLAACEGGGTGSGEGTALADAADAMLDAESMAFRVAVTVGDNNGGVVEGRGSFGTRNGEVVANYEDAEVRVIIEGDHFWFTTDDREFTAAMPREKEWVEATFAEIGDSEVVVPLERPALLYLLAGAVDTQPDGTFAVDIDKAVAAAPADRREEVRDLMWATEGEINATGKATVEDGYVRNLVVEGSVSSDDESVLPVRIRWEASFDHIGGDVTTSAPDASVVVPLEDVPEIREAFFPNRLGET